MSTTTMIAPSPGQTFQGLPSGTTYIADASGSVSVQTADVVAMLKAGCTFQISGPAPAVAVLSVSGSATLPATNGLKVDVRQTAAGTYTLPSAPLDGTTITITDGTGNFSAFNATILAGGTDAIAGAANFVMANNGESITATYVALRANWELI